MPAGFALTRAVPVFRWWPHRPDFPLHCPICQEDRPSHTHDDAARERCNQKIHRAGSGRVGEKFSSEGFGERDRQVRYSGVTSPLRALHAEAQLGPALDGALSGEACVISCHQ